MGSPSGMGQPRGLGWNLPLDQAANATPVSDVDMGPTHLSAGLLENGNTVPVWLHMWNKRSPVVGTDPQDYSWPVPAKGMLSTANSAFVVIQGGRFDVALSWAVTTDKGTTARTDPTLPPNLWLATTGGTCRKLGAIEEVAGALGAGGAQRADTLGLRTAGHVIDEAADHNPRTAKAAPGTVFAMKIDNSKNANAVFVKLYDHAAPTIGTTDPDVVVRVPAGETWIIGWMKGVAFATAITYACVTTGGTGGTAPPAEYTRLELYFS